MPACVYCAIMWPEFDTRVIGEERVQSMAAADVQKRSVRRSLMLAKVGRNDGQEVEYIPDGSTVEVAVRLHAPSSVTTGLSTAEASSRPAISCRVVDRVAYSPVNLGAQRSE